MTESTARMPLTFAALAIVTSVLALLLLGSLHLLSPEFDPSWRMVSEYARGHYGWVLSLMFAFWALGSWSLVFAIQPQLRTTGGKIGLWLLAIAGLGEAMAAVFDIRYDVMHNVAGVLGILGLPIAAMLISVRLQSSPDAKRVALWLANLTWISVVLLAAAFAVMTTEYFRAGGKMAAEVTQLPAGVTAVVGWANRLLVVVYCAWVIAVSWQAIARRELR
jgi:hypothetical protein